MTTANRALSLGAILVGVGALSGSAHAADWHKAWADEKAAALTRCAKTFEDYQLQALCMDSEKEGYQKMQGGFGLPPEVADKAKQRCAKTFDDFQLQALCMESEKEGYEKLKTY